MSVCGTWVHSSKARTALFESLRYSRHLDRSSGQLTVRRTAERPCLSPLLLSLPLPLRWSGGFSPASNPIHKIPSSCRRPERRRSRSRSDKLLPLSLHLPPKPTLFQKVTSTKLSKIIYCVHRLTRTNNNFPNKIPCQAQKPLNSNKANKIQFAKELSPIRYN